MGKTGMCAVITDAGIAVLVARDGRRLASEVQVMAVLRLPALSMMPASDLFGQYVWPDVGPVEVTVFTAHITAIIPLSQDTP